MTAFDKELEAVMEALAKVKASDAPRFGSGWISADGRADVYMHPPVEVLVNPDGAAAIKAIRDMRAEIGRLRTALKPFVRYVGKSGERVTLSIGKDVWSGSLTTKHFEYASDVYNSQYPEYVAARTALATIGDSHDKA